MIITSSNLQLAASHHSEQRHELRESLTVSKRNSQQEAANAAAAIKPPADPVSISLAGKTAYAASAAATDPAAGEDPKLTLLRLMLEAMLGRSIRLFRGSSGAPGPQGNAPASGETSAAAQQPASAGLSGVYTRHESYGESEQTRFSASGTVKTADGREISFQLNLSMSRSYYEESNLSLSFGDAAAKKKVDPLVLNFAGTAASLTNERFSFDLNADGAMEEINFVAPGSGFLVFDRNQDGIINNGSELFGPTTNDGFAELARLDDDGNGWIDENDAAFSQLQIWSRDAAGKDQLQSLAAAGVGAISLSQVATPFDIKTTSNELLGQIRNTGIFLQETGMVGTIQQIDLTA
ncbi:MAG: VCBS repeat-containing protein [Azonexus sp.]|jgi:hypothetical protein|nr:VCBS repeat-containing protein [Azonexus sp.]